MRYGDYDNVVKDSKALYDIMSRQGNTLLFECIAESLGKVYLKFNLSDIERKKIINTTLIELKQELLERI